MKIFYLLTVLNKDVFCFFHAGNPFLCLRSSAVFSVDVAQESPPFGDVKEVSTTRNTQMLSKVLNSNFNF